MPQRKPRSRVTPRPALTCRSDHPPTTARGVAGQETEKHFMRLKNDILGMRFGRWTVVSHISHGMWVCRCDCGSERSIASRSLRIGNSKSCGCLKKELASERHNFLPTLYMLPHGIEVVGEYEARGQNRYFRLRIRPHPFFPNSKIAGGAISVQRSRVVMTSIIGRAISSCEHIHHKDRDRSNDDPSNLELLSADDHNKHHKTGTRHSVDSKAKISAGLRRALAEGRKKITVITHRDEKGRIVKCAALSP